MEISGKFLTTNFASQAQVGVFIGKEYMTTSAWLKEVLNFYPPEADKVLICNLKLTKPVSKLFSIPATIDYRPVTIDKQPATNDFSFLPWSLYDKFFCILRSVSCVLQSCPF